MGVRGEVPNAAAIFAAFSKNNAFLGIFRSKFLPKNTIFILQSVFLRPQGLRAG